MDLIQKINNEIAAYVECDFLRGKTIWIIGSNGLLGSSLARFILHLNEYYQFNTRLVLVSKNPESQVKSLSHLVEYKSIDLMQLPNGLFLSQPPDIVFFMAGYATPATFLSSPLDTVYLNTHVLRSIITQVREVNSQCRMVYISSSDVYSENIDECVEDAPIISTTTNPRNFYKLSKVLGEMVMQEFINKGMSGVSIRTTACYGPSYDVNDQRVIPSLIRQGFQNPSITLLDRGDAVRTFLNIEDFLIMLLNITREGKHAVYNTASFEDTRISSIATIIGQCFLKPVILGEGDSVVATSSPAKAHLSIKRYKAEFGARTFVTLRWGLLELINWHQHNHTYDKN